MRNINRRKKTRKKTRKNRRNTRREILKKKEKVELNAILNHFNSFFKKERACNKCGICCKVYGRGIALTHADLIKEPKLKQVSRPIMPYERHAFNNEYCRVIKESDDSNECPLYDEGCGCSISETKPESCREYTPSLYNCLRARMLYNGFSLKSWYEKDAMAYLNTQLHRSTGLDFFKDFKQVFPYTLIFPFLVSEEMLQSYQELRGDRIAIGPSHLEKFIDVDGEIPNCIREYLQLDDNYQTIKDVFTPHALDAILKDIKTLHSPLNPSKMHKDHRKFIIDQMKEYLSLGLRNFPNGPAIGLEEYPDGLSVEDWAYSVAMRFIKSCAEHIDKTLTEKYFTGNGSDTIVLLDALGQDGIIIGASVFRLIDLLIIKLPSNNIPNRHVVQNAGGPVPLMSFMPYLSRDDQSVRKHCRDLSLEISHEYKRNEGDNRPIFAEFLLSLINSNGNIPVLALGLLHSILEGNAIKPILIKTIQKFENHTQLGCPVKKGLGGINLILETILNKATKLNVE